MLEKNRLPLFYFPTRICCVDDHVDFLKILQETLSKKFSCDICHDPNLFLAQNATQKSLLSNTTFLRANAESEEYDCCQQLPIHFDISKIEALSRNPKRLHELSVLIIDQHMPTLSGLSVCEKLRNVPIKKILLTGITTESQAIDAFNDGLIDKFVHKGTDNFLEQLHQYISELMYQFFCDHTKPLLKNLEADEITFFKDAAFIQFFQQYCLDHHIQEFYLIDKTGTFLLIDRNQKKSHFISMSKRSIDYFIEHHATFDDPIKTNLFNRMKRGEVLPFFGTNKTVTDIESNALRFYFYPAQKLLGNDTYFYATAKQPKLSIVP